MSSHAIVGHCSVCQQPGHNKRKCPELGRGPAAQVAPEATTGDAAQAAGDGTAGDAPVGDEAAGDAQAEQAQPEPIQVILPEEAATLPAPSHRKNCQ